MKIFYKLISIFLVFLLTSEPLFATPGKYDHVVKAYVEEKVESEISLFNQSLELIKKDWQDFCQREDLGDLNQNEEFINNLRSKLNDLKYFEKITIDDNDYLSLLDETLNINYLIPTTCLKRTVDISFVTSTTISIGAGVIGLVAGSLFLIFLFRSYFPGTTNAFGIAALICIVLIAGSSIIYTIFYCSHKKRIQENNIVINTIEEIKNDIKNILQSLKEWGNSLDKTVDSDEITIPVDDYIDKAKELMATSLKEKTFLLKEINYESEHLHEKYSNKELEMALYEKIKNIEDLTERQQVAFDLVQDLQKQGHPNGEFLLSLCELINDPKLPFYCEAKALQAMFGIGKSKPQNISIEEFYEEPIINALKSGNKEIINMLTDRFINNDKLISKKTLKVDPDDYERSIFNLLNYIKNQS